MPTTGWQSICFYGDHIARYVSTLNLFIDYALIPLYGTILGFFILSQFGHQLTLRDQITVAGSTVLDNVLFKKETIHKRWVDSRNTIPRLVVNKEWCGVEYDRMSKQTAAESSLLGALEVGVVFKLKNLAVKNHPGSNQYKRYKRLEGLKASYRLNVESLNKVYRVFLFGKSHIGQELSPDEKRFLRAIGQIV